MVGNIDGPVAVYFKKNTGINALSWVHAPITWPLLELIIRVLPYEEGVATITCVDK
jgi:hypothetical protein